MNLPDNDSDFMCIFIPDCIRIRKGETGGTFIDPGRGKMKINIPEEVIRKASQCNKDFRCLAGKEGSLCRNLSPL